MIHASEQPPHIIIFGWMFFTYLLGSLLPGYWIPRYFGINSLLLGSRNAGATNVYRLMGRRWACIVFALDCLKGWLAIMLPTWLIIQPYEYMFWVKIGAFMSVFVGHCCSIFVECKGGKGVAASIGALLALAPWPCLIGLGLWLAIFLRTRYVSLASLIFSASLPLSAYLCGLPKSIQVFLWIMSLGIICMHKSNIERLLRGEEPAFKRRFAQ